MSKGNLFQGMARGSVGDVTFSRLNGKQIARVRNRNPRNPKTNPQLYGRAIMATVMRAYSAGREIFDHSFEGVAVGAASQNRFLSLNNRVLREYLAADINNSALVNKSINTFVGPKVQSPVPGRYVISEGSLDAGLFGAYYAGGGSGKIDYSGLTTPTQGQTAAAYFSNLVTQGKIAADDLYTICVFYCDPSSVPLFEIREREEPATKQFATSFIYARLRPNMALLEATEIQAADLQVIDKTSGPESANVFYIDSYGGTGNAASYANNYLAAINFGDQISINVDDITTGSIGVIHSKVNTALRSSSEMVPSGWTVSADTPFGITAPVILDAWKQGAAQVGTSDLILEGGNA